MKSTILLCIVFLLSLSTYQAKACGSSSNVCVGTTTSLNDFYGGTWTSSNTAVATVSSTGVVTALTIGTATITNTYNSFCYFYGPSVVTTTITVIGLPTGVSGTATPNPVCTGSTVNLNGAATGATSYVWTAPGGASCAAQNCYVSGINTAWSGVYTIAATNACGTVKAYTAPVVVNTAVPTAVSVSLPASSVCAGSALSLVATATGASSYSWAGPGAVTIPASTSSSASVAAITAANAGVYTLSATNGCGKTKATSAAVAVTTGLPTGVAASATPLVLCSGSALTLAGSATGATSYSWSSPGGAAIASATSKTTSVTAVSGGNSGVYVFSATNVCGTITASSTGVAVSTSAPTSVTASLSSGMLCAGTSLSLTGAATGATGYAWSGPGGAAISTPSSLNASIGAVTTGNAGVYQFSATNICGTTSATTAPLAITAVAPSAVTASAMPGLICTGTTLTLTGTASGATNYLWTGPGGTPINTPTSLNTTVTGVTMGNTGMYTLSASNACGTTSVSTAPIVVNQQPLISASVSNVTCNGYSNGDVYLGNITISVSSPTGNYTCAWSNGQTSPYGIYGLAASVYSLTVTDGNGCATTNAYNVTQPAPITAVAAVTNSMGDTSGAINFVVSGGTAPYSYSWSNGSSSENISGLSHGDYCVSVYDGNGCAFNDCYYVNMANTGSRSANGSSTSSQPAVTETTAYPNPFTTTSNVTFTVTADGHTTVDLINAVNGQKVATIFNEDTKAGSPYSCVIDGTNLPSGLYIYKISSENNSYVGKVTLVK